MSTAHDRAFFQESRQDMPDALLRDWMNAAFSAVEFPLQDTRTAECAVDQPVRKGAPEDLRRYLLPRVLETLAQDIDIALSTEVTLDRFLTGWSDLWSADERAVIRDFVQAFIEAQRIPPSVCGALTDVFCMFARAGHSMQPLLDQVWSWPDVDFVTKMHFDLIGPHQPGLWLWKSAFWEDDLPGLHAAWTCVEDWHRSPAMLDRCLTLCLDEAQSDEIQTKAGALYDGLSLL